MENSQQQARWYVLHTYSGYESMVMENLHKLIENNNLQDVILDIVIPEEQVVEEKRGKKKVVKRKMYPCYVFVKLVYSNELWYLLTNTRGVTGFVGPSGRALPLTEDEVKRMRLEKVAVPMNFIVGDNVRVLSGPLEGYVGMVEEIDFKQQKAKVSVSMFGRQTPVELEFMQFEKI
ncbi:MAG: transcription termination/antitermination factor NusG [Clostridiales bacterium]|jgi:transcriptional antiterminator NusG|nr:transcription termination/antitermination factor NusG [Clostridiales bacterium]